MKPVIALLCVRMKRGYGVDVVAAELAKRAWRDGFSVVIGCLESDGSYEGLPIEVLPGAAERDVRAWLARHAATLVIALTSPFFELLPALSASHQTVAWENGDPTPELFADDAGARQAVKTYKRAVVYPRIHGVVAISEFIRSDIDWPRAHVVPLGADHLPAGPCKTGFDPSRGLHVGTLMRLGTGEARYKGTGDFLRWIGSLQREGVPVRASLLGRGTAEDAAAFRAQGHEVHLNASEAEKSAFLCSLDVFVSPSLWEGFNLPLAEAMRSGTCAWALDTGAHPEVTPLVAQHYGELTTMVRAYLDRPGLLVEHARRCQSFSQRFHRWDDTWAEFRELLDSGAFDRRPSRLRLPRLVHQMLAVFRHEGVPGLLRRVGAIVRKPDPH